MRRREGMGLTSLLVAEFAGYGMDGAMERV
jgi:hypothetical protein